MKRFVGQLKRCVARSSLLIKNRRGAESGSVCGGEEGEETPMRSTGGHSDACA